MVFYTAWCEMSVPENRKILPVLVGIGIATIKLIWERVPCITAMSCSHRFDTGVGFLINLIFQFSMAPLCMFLGQLVANIFGAQKKQGLIYVITTYEIVSFMNVLWVWTLPVYPAEFRSSDLRASLALRANYVILVLLVLITNMIIYHVWIRYPDQGQGAPVVPPPPLVPNVNPFPRPNVPLPVEVRSAIYFETRQQIQSIQSNISPPLRRSTRLKKSN